ncbi:MAG: carboxypeptidase-like regulatory domain-containing protein, partial [Butyricimonas faecihominis]
TGLYYEIQGKVVVIKRNLSSFVSDSSKIVTVKGVVKDTRGSGLPGVTVVLKGTTTGVATANNGDFTMTLPQHDSMVLVFSFVGMKTKEVTWKGEKALSVVMEEEVSEMEEVVITGYQVIDRRKSTSAINSVKMEDIMIPGVSSIDKMLEGQIPDLMVMTNSGESGVAPRIRIRGTSTLIGNREPLWVVDGVIVQDPVQISPDELNDPDYINRIGNAISGLNPQDINVSIY